MQSIGQRHVAIAVMVAVGFTVRGNVHELRPRTRVRKPALQSPGKLLTAVQQLLECYRLGNGSIVKEQIDPAAGGQPGKIGARGINAATAHVSPASSANLACSSCLALRQDGELDSETGK